MLQTAEAGRPGLHWTLPRGIGHLFVDLRVLDVFAGGHTEFMHWDASLLMRLLYARGGDFAVKLLCEPQTPALPPESEGLLVERVVRRLGEEVPRTDAVETSEKAEIVDEDENGDVG